MIDVFIRDNEELAPSVREIGWTHGPMIMEKCKDDLERGERSGRVR
jgi:hypothetical protein